MSNAGACFRICSTQPTPAMPFPTTTSFFIATAPRARRIVCSWVHAKSGRRRSAWPGWRWPPPSETARTPVRRAIVSVSRSSRLRIAPRRETTSTRSAGLSRSARPSLRVHFQPGRRRQVLQDGDLSGLGARVPVLDGAAGVEHERKFFVRLLGKRLPARGNQPRLFILGLKAAVFVEPARRRRIARAGRIRPLNAVERRQSAR